MSHLKRSENPLSRTNLTLIRYGSHACAPGEELASSALGPRSRQGAFYKYLRLNAQANSYGAYQV